MLASHVQWLFLLVPKEVEDWQVSGMHPENLAFWGAHTQSTRLGWYSVDSQLQRPGITYRDAFQQQWRQLLHWTSRLVDRTRLYRVRWASGRLLGSQLLLGGVEEAALPVLTSRIWPFQKARQGTPRHRDRWPLSQSSQRKRTGLAVCMSVVLAIRSKFYAHPGPWVIRNPL